MSTLITNSNELTQFTAVFSKHDLAADLAPRLSCIEVEALADRRRALGEPATSIEPLLLTRSHKIMILSPIGSFGLPRISYTTVLLRTV